MNETLIPYSKPLWIMGRLTTIMDTVRRFTATVTSDWNGNITSVQEVIPGGMNVTSTFVYDYENRLTEYAVGGTNFSVEHTYDGYNRLVKTDATIGANTQNFEHVYSGSRFIGSVDVTNPLSPVTGKVWQWGVGFGNHGKNELLESPQIKTASARNYYNVNDEKNTQRKSYINNAITAGDSVDPARMCSETLQVNGTVTPTRALALPPSISELFSAYAFTLDADRAVYAYGGEGTLAILATDLEFEGSRVKTPVLGRDLNPMGRGDGTYYAQGAMGIAGAKTMLIGEVTTGFGNSVCNGEAVPAVSDLGGGVSSSGAGECCGKNSKTASAQAPSCCGFGQQPNIEDRCADIWRRYGVGGQPHQRRPGLPGVMDARMSVHEISWRPGYTRFGSQFTPGYLVSSAMRKVPFSFSGISKGDYLSTSSRRLEDQGGDSIGSGKWCIRVNPRFWGVRRICFPTKRDAEIFYLMFCHISQMLDPLGVCNSNICGEIIRGSSHHTAHHPSPEIGAEYDSPLPFDEASLGGSSMKKYHEKFSGILDCLEDLRSKYSSYPGLIDYLIGLASGCLTEWLIYIGTICMDLPPYSRAGCIADAAKELASCLKLGVTWPGAPLGLIDQMETDILKCFADILVGYAIDDIIIPKNQQGTK